MKTNAARQLDQLGIKYELREYEVEAEHLDAATVAARVGLPPEQVFKTLLTTGGTGVYAFAVIPGDAELDFKKRPLPVWADETIELFDVVSVSAGVRGTQILLAPADYLRAAGATPGPIARESR